MRMLQSLTQYLTPTSVSVGVVAGLLTYWLLLKKRYNLPPGPWAWPLIGDFTLIKTKFAHEKVLEYTKTYGPVLTIHLGPFPVVVLNNIEVVLEALVKRGSDFANRFHITTLDEFTEGAKDIAMADYTPTWKLHRKIVSKAFRNYLKGDGLETTIQGSMGKVVKLLQKEKGPFDPTKYIDLCVFNIQCGFCFDTSYELDDEEFLHIMKCDKDLLVEFGVGSFEDIFPYFRHVFPTKQYLKIKKLSAEMLSYMENKIDEHRKVYCEDNIHDFVDFLLHAKKEAESEEDSNMLSKLTDVHIRQTISDIFFAGVDTSRFTLYWCLLYMASHPSIQERCQKEIDEVVGSNRLPSPNDKPQLPYTEATLHEVMRIGTVAPLGIFHAALRDSTIGGYDIPKGTTILVNHFQLHMDPDHWKEPEKFDPTRFLEDGKLAPKPDSWLPFSAGRRVCLGESVAKPELLTILATFLQQFKMKIPEGVTADLSMDGNSFGAFPKRYQLVMEPRN